MSYALALLKNYATAGIYGLANDMPYCRESHMGIVVDYDYAKRLGSMRFRLRRCATEYDGGRRVQDTQTWED
jgi:hypothetical protein